MDLEGEWDPAKHDEQMAKIYADDEVYEDEDELVDEKPQWDDDIDIGEIIVPENDNDGDGASKKKKKKKKKKRAMPRAVALACRLMGRRCIFPVRCSVLGNTSTCMQQHACCGAAE